MGSIQYFLMNAKNSSSPATPEQALSSKHALLAAIVCALITTAGGVYTATSNSKSQTEIEALKRDAEQQIAKIKSDTERAIKESELKTQENVILLKEQFEQEKDKRAKTTAEEASVKAAAAARCDEIKVIHSQMSEDITHIRYNDPLTENALSRLDVNYNKLTVHLSRAGWISLKESMSNPIPSNQLQAKKDFYKEILEAYSAELRAGCMN